jgi:hypothetical protein
MAKKIKNPFASITKGITKIFDKIMKPILQIVKYVTDIVKYIKCGVNKIINLPKCIIFYIVDIIIATYFMFWNLIASMIPGLKSVGKMIWKATVMLDKYIYKYTDMHIISYPRSILKRCYLC